MYAHRAREMCEKSNETGNTASFSTISRVKNLFLQDITVDQACAVQRHRLMAPGKRGDSCEIGHGGQMNVSSRQRPMSHGDLYHGIFDREGISVGHPPPSYIIVVTFSFSRILKNILKGRRFAENSGERSKNRDRQASKAIPVEAFRRRYRDQGDRRRLRRRRMATAKSALIGRGTRHIVVLKFPRTNDESVSLLFSSVSYTRRLLVSTKNRY